MWGAEDLPSQTGKWWNPAGVNSHLWKSFELSNSGSFTHKCQRLIPTLTNGSQHPLLHPAAPSPLLQPLSTHQCQQCLTTAHLTLGAGSPVVPKWLKRALAQVPSQALPSLQNCPKKASQEAPSDKWSGIWERFKPINASAAGAAKAGMLHQSSEGEKAEQPKLAASTPLIPNHNTD